MASGRDMDAPDFLVVGHVAKDVGDGSWRLGGTVAYAAIQAERLGLRSAVVTRASTEMDLEQLLPNVSVHCVPSESTTTFENRYENGRRVQHAFAQAPPIGPEHVPEEWREARMVLLGSLLGEVPIELGRLFGRSLLGFCAQGWLRDVRSDGLVVRRSWSRTASLRGGGVVVVSEDDIEGDGGAVDLWIREVPLVVVTGGKGGARLHADGRWRRIAAFPHEEVDPTGAGDVFAAAFMISYSEAGDVGVAARFAGAAAALSVGAAGTARVATREAIEGMLADYPEVTLR
jgi:Sugar kinases, ribokinase family